MSAKHYLTRETEDNVVAGNGADRTTGKRRVGADGK
jgi:hypothetical protein